VLALTINAVPTAALATGAVGANKFGAKAVVAAALETQGGVTPGSYTKPSLTASSRGIVTAIATTTEVREYIQVGLNASQAVSSGGYVIFNSVNPTSGHIAYDTGTGVFTLTAGKTYYMYANLVAYFANSADTCWFDWVIASGANAGARCFNAVAQNNPTTASNAGSNSTLITVFQPYTGATTVAVRVLLSYNATVRNETALAFIYTI
jgi:hypothetical protein